MTISAPQQLGLADSLFEQSEFEEAVGEYRRFVYFFPDDPAVAYADFKIAQAYFMRRNFEKALPLLEAISGKGGADRYAVEACFLASRCDMSLGRQAEAEAALKKLAASTEDIDVRDRAYYHLGWLCLESGAALDAAAVNRAGEYFARISDNNRDIYKVGEMTERLGGPPTDGQGPLASRKSPALAGALAVFPGGGYVYCGRYHDALMSFLLNGALACSAGEAFHGDLDALGAVISLVGIGFYSGSIYGSVSAAHKYNRKVSRDFLQSLNDTRMYFSPVAGGNGAMASFHVSF